MMMMIVCAVFTVLPPNSNCLHPPWALLLLSSLLFAFQACLFVCVRVCVCFPIRPEGFVLSSTLFTSGKPLPLSTKLPDLYLFVYSL